MLWSRRYLMCCWPNGECCTINRVNLLKQNQKYCSKEILLYMYLFLFLFENVVQYRQIWGGECNLKTILYQFCVHWTYCEILEKEWIHGWRQQMQVSNRHNYYWRYGKRDKLLCFLLCLVCYIWTRQCLHLILHIWCIWMKYFV